MGVTVRRKVRRKGATYHVFISVNGTRRSKSVGDKRAANAVASKLRAKMRAGELNLELAGSRKRSPEFSAYSQHYLDHARRSCKPSTYHSYRMIIKRHLTPAWKGKLLSQVTRADVKELLLQKQEEGYAVGTLENIKALISGIFTFAFEEELLTKNPAAKVGKFIKKYDLRREVKPLTREQASEFLRVALEEYPQHYALLLTAFRTGMRLGELLALAWSDIDFAANTITVQRSYTHGQWGTPKSGKLRRVDVSDQLKRVLLEHCDAVRERFGGRLPVHAIPSRNGGTAPVELVFPSETGGPICGDNFRSRVFYKLLDKADVPRFRIHDIRHTFASLLLAQGESLHYVKEQMGHASITTTVDVYGHLVLGSNRSAVNRLDDPEEPALRVVPANAG